VCHPRDSDVIRHDALVSISDKDRKILWARSGNRCALCRRVLVAERTATDDEAIVGDEAHIAARSPGGSRYGECPTDIVDRYDNLILLCRVDHKKVDDQPQHYTTARLRQVKTEHEEWVERTLGNILPPIRFQFDTNNIFFRAQLMHTGGDVWHIIEGAHRFFLEDLDEDGADPDDLACSADFLQNARDWGEISSEVADNGMRAVREAKNSLAIDLKALQERDFLVLGGRRHGVITGGVGPPSPIADAYLIVLRADDPRVTDQADKTGQFHGTQPDSH